MAVDRRILTSAIFITISTLLLVNCHPQCLDFTVPFRPQGQLSFCTDYQAYSCCGAKQDKRLEEQYGWIEEELLRKDKSNQQEEPECLAFVKELLCAGCHPYAAHLFDAENPPSLTNDSVGISKRQLLFPGLCTDYCQIKFTQCKTSLTLLFSGNKAFSSFLNEANPSQFCSWAKITDEDYCYPNSKDLGVDSVVKWAGISESTVTLCVKEMAHGLRNPLQAVPANDGTHRLFIVQQNGIIKVANRQFEFQETPFLNLSHRILNSGEPWDERGLLGLVFHPRYERNGRFFVFYSSKEGNDLVESSPWWEQTSHQTTVSEFVVSAHDPNQADVDSEVILLRVSQPEANHNGGMMLFADDGYLYVFIGDGGGAGDIHGIYGNGLNMSTLLGKAIRIDVDVYDGRAYAIPRDNPFVNDPSIKSEIYAYGIRNIWRCSIDRGNPSKGNRMFCGDVGQDTYEEIDIIEKGGNYGWRGREGHECYDEAICNSTTLMANAIPPILTYNHSYGKSIVGGFVYRGCQNPLLRGKYIYGDTMSGRVFLATENEANGKWDSKEVIFGDDRVCNNGLGGLILTNILSFGEDEAGELYILATDPPIPDYSSGRIYQLVDPFRAEDPSRCKIRPAEPKQIKPNSRYVRTRNPGALKPCKDRRSFCQSLSKFKRFCRIIVPYAKTYCPVTCGFC